EITKKYDDKTTGYAVLSHRWGAKRAGYQKIIESCRQAKQDGYKWLWVDTCCIDKRSSAELSEAINSMYRWYQNARLCYAYLNDVDQMTSLKWFVRGWTLQELIGPKEVKFYNKDWPPIGNKRHVASTLEDIMAGIPREVLRDSLATIRLGVAQIMS
ncbi:hypothetical protein PISMIDRAFT_100002, partial [Pisolithus microcarpus 441]